MRTIISTIIASLVAVSSLASANAPQGFGQMEESSVHNVFAINKNAQVVTLEGYVVNTDNFNKYEFIDRNGDKIAISFEDKDTLSNIDMNSIVKVEAKVKKEFVKTSLIGLKAYSL